MGIPTRLKKICTRNDSVICPVNKGGGIVILDKCKNLEEMNRLLSYRSNYTPLASNPTAKFKRELSGLIDDRFRQGILNKEERTYLVPSVPGYVLLAKNLTIQNLSKPPGSPIISSIDSVTARIGRYVD